MKKLSLSSFGIPQTQILFFCRMKLSVTIVLVVIVVVFISCNRQQKVNFLEIVRNPHENEIPAALSALDSIADVQTLSLLTGIELFAIELLQKETNAKPEHLKTYFSCVVIPDDPNRNQHIPNGVKIVHLPGICFAVDALHDREDILRKLRPSVEPKGYKLFMCDGNDLYDKKKIAIVRCEDEFTPLVYMQTNGINYGIYTHNLIARLDSLNTNLDLKLMGADFAWCEFEIRKEPKDWHKLAQKLYEICPDIVDQGTGDLATLEAELRRSKRLYFWFD